jgi:hypothetical protein
MEEIDKIINKIDKEIKKDSKQINEMEKNKQIDNIAYSSIKKRIIQNEITKKRYIMANKEKQAIYEAIYSFLSADNLDKSEKKNLYNRLKILNENYTEYDYYGLNPLFEDYYKYFRIVADYICIILEKNGFKEISYCDKDDEILAYHIGVYIYEKNNLIVCIKDKYIKQNCEICNKSTINIIIDKYMTKKEVDEYLKNL